MTAFFIPSITPELRRLAALTLVLAWCAVLVVARVVLTHSLMYAFLSWNVFLACIPFAAAIALRRSDARGSSLWKQLGWFLVWLLFLPNAPYIMTDLLHLGPKPPAPLWYDLAMLLSCGAVGLALGYMSLFDVHVVIERRFGSLVAWGVAVASMFLSGFGIYLGRYQRWNSWDIINNPSGLFADIADRIINPMAHPRTYGVTLLFGVGLTLGYALLRTLFAEYPSSVAQPASRR